MQPCFGLSSVHVKVHWCKRRRKCGAHLGTRLTPWFWKCHYQYFFTVSSFLLVQPQCLLTPRRILSQGISFHPMFSVFYSLLSNKCLAKSTGQSSSYNTLLWAEWQTKNARNPNSAIRLQHPRVAWNLVGHLLCFCNSYINRNWPPTTSVVGGGIAPNVTATIETQKESLKTAWQQLVTIACCTMALLL